MRRLPLLICAAAVCCFAEESADDAGHVFSLASYVRTAMKEATEQLDRRLDDLVSRFVVLDSRLDRLDERLDVFDERLDSLEARPEPAARVAGGPVRDCGDLPPGTGSGVHLLYPNATRPPIVAHCDMDTDGGNWTVFQRRGNFLPRQDFFLGWEAYKAGFGDPSKEFWMGLENIWRLTSRSDRQYELRIDMEDGGEKRFAVYQGFSISSKSDGYRLKAANFTGNSGDSLINHIGQRFSTRDKDQDSSAGRNCADKYKGGWWYRSCHYSNLNALYRAGPAPKEDGISWETWKGYKYSLERVEMKMRPV